ncbi:MAG: CsoS2 family carboxysome shell protein [Thiogranum sp.]|nr:CsoS2 family carboxysome shell protein [Thiogranum sp.]
MGQTASNQSARELARARREALASQGKAAVARGTTASAATPGAATPASATVGSQARRTSSARQAQMPSGREASRARRAAMSSGGKAAVRSPDRSRSEVVNVPRAEAAAPVRSTQGCGCSRNGEAPIETGMAGEAVAKPAPARAHRNMRRQSVSKSAGRAASQARREAMSSRGKAGVSANGMSAAQTARAGNPDLTSRELARLLREQRSRQGKTGGRKSVPCGRVRPKTSGETAAAQDAPWKVGAGETTHGQTVTGTMVGRSRRTTGDEPSTCRAITGTEYLGADIFREFCQTEAAGTPAKVAHTSTSRGNAVTGSRIGRGMNVTGDEVGTCKRITGDEYVGAEQTEAFCGTKAEPRTAGMMSSQTRKGKTLTGANVDRTTAVTGNETGAGRVLTGTQYMQPGQGEAPAKVGSSKTLRGGSVTGTMVGRSGRVTGDEPGACRNVTGDEYTGQEQYSSFCERAPQPQDARVGVSATFKGYAVTGTMTGRTTHVTGAEPGTCKAVTGTPYAGAEQYRNYCTPDEEQMALARRQQRRSTPGSVMTGLQPGIGGKATGDSRGACEPVSGTPYLGADQYANVCPATAADPASPDFPQPLAAMPWSGFSVAPPAVQAQKEHSMGGVTGGQSSQGHITGPFGMALGKVTGTEDARYGQDKAGAAAPSDMLPATAETLEGRVKSRVTGEGMDPGSRITGDDWDRGDRVTGTEGMSATRRNPTLRSAATPGAPVRHKRNEEVPAPVSKVTGGSGNTEKGALVTYSGGARG